MWQLLSAQRVGNSKKPQRNRSNESEMTEKRKSQKCHFWGGEGGGQNLGPKMGRSTLNK